MPDVEPVPLAYVVGVNARRLRADATGDRLAGAARQRGLNWGTGRVADLEAGRVSPTMPMLIALALALGDLRGEPIKLSDLLYVDGFVSVAGDLILSGEAIARYVSDWPVQVLIRDVPGGLAEVNDLHGLIAEVTKDARRFRGVTGKTIAAVARNTGEAENRAAKTLGVDELDIALASSRLWKQSLSAERDARAGRDASAQKRGQVTRQLYTELRAALDGND